MILVKYALLLFLLCSAVVPGNSGRGNQVAVPGSNSANKNEVPSTRRRRRHRQITSEKNSEQESKKDKFFSWSKEEIEKITNYIAGHKNKLHPDGNPRRISLDTLKKLERETPNSESMPHWPPSAHIGGVYWTEPLNFVSIESFSTRIS
jgi:hypothetical protein